jgi:phosphoenolpyruvate phosphomutase
MFRSRSQRLRQILGGPGCAMLAGAHDALSGRLVEETGYDAVWAGSFGISLAGHCLPDADLLTMTECLETARRMVDTVRIPVLADCNAGFGNAVNVMRLVREFEAAGVAGICIEDNPFPKRSSLYEGWRRELVPIQEMVGRVSAAQSAKRTSDFVVVARVESLIAEEGVEMALQRSTAYAEAGADALLVHGREFDSLVRFTERWRDDLPLIAVPTLYPQVRLADLAEAGFAAVIFPNQAVRAAVRAMCETLSAMHLAGTCGAVEDDIVSLAEVDRLVRLNEMHVAERAFAGAATTH